MPGKVKVTPHMRNTASGGRTHVRGQNRAAPKTKQPNAKQPNAKQPKAKQPKAKPIKTKK